MTKYIIENFKGLNYEHEVEFVAAFSAPKMPAPPVAEPVPTEQDPAVKAKIDAAQMDAANRSKKGRSSTILSGPQGLLDAPSTSRTLQPAGLRRDTTNGKY